MRRSFTTKNKPFVPKNHEILGVERANQLEIAQYLRFHMVSARRLAAKDGTRPKRKQRGPRAMHPLEAKVQEIGRPYEGFCLIFDTETTTFDGQRLRFGSYQIRGIAPEHRLKLARSGKLTRAHLDTLQERGIFYAEENLTPTDIELLRSYAAGHGINLMSRVEFVRDVLVGTGRYRKDYWQYDGLIIGFSFAFDTGTIASEFWLAQGNFFGGFGFKMSSRRPPPSGPRSARAS
jgi:hypothetical protein